MEFYFYYIISNQMETWEIYVEAAQSSNRTNNIKVSI